MSISEQDLLDAISAWGNRLVEISMAFENEGIVQATSVAENMLDRLYGFNLGPVLFKPTLSGGIQTFRPTRRLLFLTLLDKIRIIPVILALELNIGVESSRKRQHFSLMTMLRCGWAG